jgi:hypothetical protein
LGEKMRGSRTGSQRRVDMSRRWHMKAKDVLERAREVAGRLEFASDDSGQSQYLETLILIGMVIVVAGLIVAIVDAVGDKIKKTAEEIRGLEY